ncbi:putative bifunctional diguanylate cyclase/phosphodiesterase [Actinoplanes sp. NPDC049265]|uniref:putative bifunctional diguanylate cyclase/phosphodiesterase n=1 Tax=Actinoplanes sp. NPDC049265 TaxID=3363902 RepID=UPI003718F917
MRHHRVAGAVAVLVAVALAGQAVVLTRPEMQNAVTAATMTVLDLLGAVVSLLAARDSVHRRAWQLAAAARFSSGVADLLLAINPVPGPPGWWVGAAAAMLTYPLLALAAVSFPAAHLMDRQRWALTGEAVAVLGCGFMFVWHFTLQPHLEAGVTAQTALMKVGFPIGDLLLLIGISAYLLRGGVRESSLSSSLLVAGMGGYLVSDSIFNAIGDDGNYATGPLLATLTFVGALLLMTVAAVLENSATRRSSGDVPLTGALLSPWLAYFPYAAVGAGLVLMITVTLEGENLLKWGGMVLGLVVMAGGVAVRQLVSMRDSRQSQITDHLTGLANRVGLQQVLDRCLRRGEHVAVLAIDLDGFKSVNDTYGHFAGDLVLMEFAQVLRGSVRAGDLAARVGGDEFLVLARDLGRPEDARAIADRIQSAAHARPVRVGADTIVHRCSIGVAVDAPDDSGDLVLRHSDMAMYHAKRAGNHGVAVYHPGMIDRRGDDTTLSNDLENAVASGQLRVLFQPMIDLASGRPVGAEALVRWHHPTRGLVSPLDFIPLAERTGTINGIGRYVLEQACREVRAWQQTTPHLYASVNLSPRQLQDSALVGDVLGVLERTGLAPKDLVLEITESAIIDERVAIPALTELRAHGVRVAIDDFGTGYSSLQYLARLPVDILKIDRSFVAELDGTSQGSAITEAVIRLSQVLHLTTVAEGIETSAQAAELAMLGCDIGQGYLFAKPVSATEAAELVTAQDWSFR